MAAARGFLRERQRNSFKKETFNTEICQSQSMWCITILSGQFANDGRVLEPLKTFSRFFLFQETQTYLGPSQSLSTYKVLDLIQHAQF